MDNSGTMENGADDPNLYLKHPFYGDAFFEFNSGGDHVLWDKGQSAYIVEHKTAKKYTPKMAITEDDLDFAAWQETIIKMQQQGLQAPHFVLAISKGK